MQKGGGDWQVGGVCSRVCVWSIIWRPDDDGSRGSSEKLQEERREQRNLSARWVSSDLMQREEKNASRRLCVRQKTRAQRTGGARTTGGQGASKRNVEGMSGGGWWVGCRQEGRGRGGGSEECVSGVIFK